MNRHVDISGEAREGGFTLVELLIAMAVAALLMVSLLSILSKSMDVSKSANASMMSKASAQAALDLMVTDLDSLVVSRNAGEVLRLVPSTPVAGAASAVTNTEMYLLTTSMVDSYSGTNAGMPRLVQYSIRYTTNFASVSSNSFVLCRDVLEPANTFSNVIASGNTLNSSWSNNALNRDPRTNIPNSYNNVLVPNAVAMNVNIYTNYGAGIWMAGAVPTNAINSTNFPSGLVVEVALTILDEPYIQRFGNGGGPGNNSRENLIRQYGRTLVRRVSLPSPP